MSPEQKALARRLARSGVLPTFALRYALSVPGPRAEDLIKRALAQSPPRSPEALDALIASAFAIETFATALLERVDSISDEALIAGLQRVRRMTRQFFAPEEEKP